MLHIASLPTAAGVWNKGNTAEGEKSRKVGRGGEDRRREVRIRSHTTQTLSTNEMVGLRYMLKLRRIRGEEDRKQSLNRSSGMIVFSALLWPSTKTTASAGYIS